MRNLGTVAELECWQNKLDGVQKHILEADLLEGTERTFTLASLQLQERFILECISELSSKLKKPKSQQRL